MKQTILVTGYSGFVGRHVCEKLEEFYSLRLFGRKPSSFGNVHFGAISSLTDFNLALKGIDCVIHIAGYPSYDSSKLSREEFLDVNLHGAITLAKTAGENGVKRFIFISSAKVNGESTTDREPFVVSECPKPSDLYAISKADAEKAIMEIASEYGMEFVFIRPPLVYGPGVRSNFASLLKLVKRKIPLPFGSISNNKRSLVSTANLADLVAVCISHPAAKNQTFFVSDDHDVSTLEMVELMAKASDINSLMVPFPIALFKFIGRIAKKMNAVDRLVGSLQVDITLTKETLNWSPPQSIEQGFREVANHESTVNRL